MNAEAKILTLDASTKKSLPPEKIDDIPATFVKCYGAIDKFIYYVLSRRFETSIAEMWFCYIKLKNKVKRFSRKSDVVFSTYQKRYPNMAVKKASKRVVKAMYLMDPFSIMFLPDVNVENESESNLKLLEQYDVIFTTRFIKEAIVNRGYAPYVKRIVEISFPMITGFSKVSEKKDSEKITLLFSGSLYEDIRSPKYYLNIVSRLDSRFRVEFIGPNCTAVKKYNVKTNAELILSPRVKYEEMIEMMGKADILINIGNSVPVHIPSKVFEYINTGKPFVNFYKLDDCPSLYYTNRYPLCLNLSEKDEDIDAVAEKFIDFCIRNKNEQLDREWIKENYKESTPEFIAKQIDDTLSELCEQKREK